MTRVQRAHPGAHRSALDRSRAPRKKKPYKIVLEAVTKKKRHALTSYNVDAPQGYSFVPAGHPDLTKCCKELCSQRDLNVFVVSAKAKGKLQNDPEKLSHHVHRIGHHFPNRVVDEACDVLGYVVRGNDYQKSTTALYDTRLARTLEDHGQRLRLHGRPVTENETKEQISLSMRDLFPKMPDNDLNSIVRHAFRENTNRVGNAFDLPLARRVQLAVVAHIRHMYTDYDNLLKSGTWHDARARVEQHSLAKLREWRDEQDMDEVEETFREVIVIDDDDEEEEDDSHESDQEREPSLEIISSRAAPHELQPDDLADVERTDAYGTHGTTGKPYRQRPVLRFRYPHIQTRPGSYIVPRPPPRFSGVGLDKDPRVSLHTIAHSRPLPPRAAARPPPLPPASRDVFRGEDGRLYHLPPLEGSRAHPVSVEYDRRPPRAQLIPTANLATRYPGEEILLQYTSSPSREYVSRHDRPAHWRRTSDQDIVLPSIEHDSREFESQPSPGSLNFISNSPRGTSGRPPHGIATPKRRDFPSPVYEYRDQFEGPTSKRLRPAQVNDEIVESMNGGLVNRALRHTREPMDPQREQRISLVQHSDIIDLTASPQRSLRNGSRPVVEYVRVISHPTSRPTPTYVPAPSRESLVRDTRSVFCDNSPRELSRAYTSVLQGLESGYVPLPRPREIVEYIDDAQGYRRTDDDQRRRGHGSVYSR